MPIWFGGDYNPEQWPEEIWNEDVRLMQRAHVTMATVGVFSWARLEPREGQFDFGWLDRVLDTLHTAGVRVDLATATASPPPWLTHAHPEVLPVTEDGVRLSPGSRQHYCPSSPIYRAAASRLVWALAERYGNHPAVEMWHVNNEFGCHVSHCYCDISADAFRVWLTERYETIDALNAAWGTSFWSQRYGTFEEVLPPRAAPSFRNPTQLLDFDRFSSDALLECYRAEAVILRSTTPTIPVTTNFMGFFKPVNYWEWAAEVDVVSDDAYPDPADPDSPHYAAMVRDLVRSLGAGRPWLLMEQAPSAVNWRRHNAPKAAGQMRAWSYQAVARGADGVLFFQWRQSAAGAEKYHSGMLPHAGTDTRVWREIELLGAELSALSSVGIATDGTAEAPLPGSTVQARVAIVFEWDSWWALEQAATPGQLDYVRGVFDWHRQFTERGLPVDFVRANHAELRKYDVVIVPSLVAASDAQLANLDGYARGGGRLIVSYQTGITDLTLRVRDDGYLGILRDTLGLWVEEFAPPAGPDLAAAGLAPQPALAVAGSLVGDPVPAHRWGEYVRTQRATVLAEFVGGDLDGWPAITRHGRGDGQAWYVATALEPRALSALLDAALDDVIPPTTGVVTGNRTTTEVVQRGDLLFVINHGPTPVAITTEGLDVLSGRSAKGMQLVSQGVAVVRRAPADNGSAH